MTAIIFFSILIGIVCLLSIVLYRRKKESNKLPDEEPVQNEIVPVVVGKHTVWLRNCEIENFKAQPRRMRIFIAHEFERKVRKGILVPVKENSKIKGFITRQEAKEKGVI